MSSDRNTYLEEVVAAQGQLEQDMRAKRSISVPAQMAAPSGSSGGGLAGRLRAVGGMPSGSAPATVDVRVTGFWRWKTVLVPPNAFVVHTRRGHAEPLHVGLGTSFRFRPATDSYQVVPGAMQTILISAYCICKELQGVLIQAYVQWIIQDFATAYRKLDFSDAEDPMRLVNLQLKEQAEAAIKDTVSTMGVHEVLSDKQPIVEELTARLRAVAEGESGADGRSASSRASDRGLGLRIVTVQIKEAIVSSSRLWANLQKPFRSEQERIGRVAELEAGEAISARELAASRAQETQQLEVERALAELRSENQALAFDRDAAERARRAERDEADARRLAELRNETAVAAMELERSRDEQEREVGRLRLEREQELARLALDAELATGRARRDAAHEVALLEVEVDRLHAAIENERSPIAVQASLVDALPEIVGKLPKPTELRSVTIGGSDTTTLAGLVAQLTAVVAALRSGTES
jgi:regulator of protease activity HflC (stomatin/prohibitin superfamily)